MPKQEQQGFRPKLGRRGFLKVAVVSGVALATAGLEQLIGREQTEPALAGSGTGPYYYGTDSNTASNVSKLSQNYYIGRTGGGTLIYPASVSGFSPTAADQAGTLYTHTYWLLKGPYYVGKGSRTNYEYGQAQATKACDAWSTHVYSTRILGRTIFADIEDDPAGATPETRNGWVDYNNNNSIDQAANRAVLNGFLDRVVSYTLQGVALDFVPGVYTRSELWQSWLGGANYRPTQAFVVWLAGADCSICSPNGSCTTTKSDADNRFNTKKGILFGNYKTVIWQYYVNATPCDTNAGDYDIACQNGYKRFKPICTTFLPLILKDSSSGGGARSAGGKAPATPNALPTPNPYPPPPASVLAL